MPGKGAVCQSGGLATICTRSVGLLPGLCPQKAGPGVANYWPLYKALKLSAMEIALSDPNFRFSRTESLTHCAVTSTTAALQHRARVRVEDLVKRASAPLKPFEHEVRRANLRHVVQVVVEFRQVLHRDDPERLRRHLHVVVATFDGRWQIGRQTEEMLQRVHSPALGADVAAADRSMSGLDTMTNSSRPTSRATMAARQLARGVFPLPLSP